MSRSTKPGAPAQDNSQAPGPKDANVNDGVVT